MINDRVLKISDMNTYTNRGSSVRTPYDEGGKTGFHHALLGCLLASGAGERDGHSCDEEEEMC